MGTIQLKVKHIYPDGHEVIRYISENIFDLALGQLPKGHRYQIIEGDIPGMLQDEPLKDKLERMEVDELKFFAHEKGVSIGAMKSKEKIISKILEVANI